MRGWADIYTSGHVALSTYALLLLRLLLLLPVLRLVQRSALGTPGRLKQFVFDMGLRIASLATSAVPGAQLFPVPPVVVALLPYLGHLSCFPNIGPLGKKKKKVQ